MNAGEISRLLNAVSVDETRCLFQRVKKNPRRTSNGAASLKLQQNTKSVSHLQWSMGKRSSSENRASTKSGRETISFLKPTDLRNTPSSPIVLKKRKEYLPSSLSIPEKKVAINHYKTNVGYSSHPRRTTPSPEGRSYRKNRQNSSLRPTWSRA